MKGVEEQFNLGSKSKDFSFTIKRKTIDESRLRVLPRYSMLQKAIELLEEPEADSLKNKVLAMQWQFVKVLK